MLEFTQADNVYIFLLVNFTLFSKFLYNSYAYYQFMNNFIENQYEKCSYDIKKLFISNGFFFIVGIVLFFLFEPYRNVLLFDFCFQIYNFCLILYLKYKYEQEYSTSETNPISTPKIPNYV